MRSPLQLGHLVEQVLKDIIVDLVRDRRDQGLGLLSAVAAERTDLRPLELVQVLVRAEQALDGLDVLLLLEARKGVEVVDGLGEDLGLLEALAVVAPLGDQRVDDERRLGQRQRVDVLELAQDHVRAHVLVPRRQGLGP